MLLLKLVCKGGPTGNRQCRLARKLDELYLLCFPNNSLLTTQEEIGNLAKNLLGTEKFCTRDCVWNVI